MLAALLRYIRKDETGAYSVEFALIARAMWPGLPDPARDGEIVAIGSVDDRDLLVVAVGTGGGIASAPIPGRSSMRRAR